MTYSALIDDVIAAAQAEGNSVLEISTGWTKVREVVHMALPMTDELRGNMKVNPMLRYWAAERTPHNRAEEGFIDDKGKVGVSFPRG